MPYSFVQIEQDKSRAIHISVAVLVLFYFAAALLMVAVVKYVMASSYTDVSPEALSLGALLTPGTILWTLGGAAFAGFIHWQFSINAMVDRTISLMGARLADPACDDEQVFKNVVDEVAIAIGGKQAIEAYIIPTSAMNAFALQDFEGRALIGITEGLLRRLNREELEAVIAHEAGHIASGDCKETTAVSAIFKAFDNLCDITGRMVWMSGNVATLSSGRREGSRRDTDGRIMLILILVYLMALALRFFGMLGAFFISRQREYRADAISAKLTRNPLALAEALAIISQRWKGAGMPGEAMEAVFILNPRQNAIEESSNVIADLFTTHPPVGERINILLSMAHADAASLDAAVEKARARGAVSKEPVDSFVQTPLPTGIPISLPPFGMPGSAETVSVKKDACPRCQAALVPHLYEGCPVQECAACHGLFAGEADVLQIVHTRDVEFDGRIRGLAELMRQQPEPVPRGPFDAIYNEPGLLCPSCAPNSVRMKRRFVSPAYPVEIDKCPTCAKVWFDKDEIEILQYLYEKDHPA
ncbi:MAG: M48 family metalloprotease [Candidatus Omnitrophica bacterium]|nr:M48 family metalloprotease [Candidatus Omnitrophota bacterium]